MRGFAQQTKAIISRLPPGSWLRALAITCVSVSIFTLALATAYIFGLLYLYSFDRDPRRWTNLIAFYARPEPVGEASIPNSLEAAVRQIRLRNLKETASEPALLGSLVIRGNKGNTGYATQYQLNLADIKSSALHDCLLAAEDKRFYRHAGVDYLGIAGALYQYYANSDRLRGASTISNQLMGDVILSDRSREGLRAFWRKFEEIILTNVAERHFSKADLLLAYVNNVPVGHSDGRALIGLSAASEALFGKRDPRSLTLSEACALAGILNRPNGYLKEALKGDYRGIAKKRDIVLENLGSANPERYSKEAIERAKKEEIRFFKNRKPSTSEPRQFIRYAYQQLPSKKPGLRVYLTVDPSLQRAAEASVSQELARFDRGPYGFYNQLSHRHTIKQRANATGEESKLQAALVALDAKTGEILAMVGGREKSEFNRATQAKRAPGSLIKPFVYLHGIDSGSYAGQKFRADTAIDPSRSPIAQRYTTGGAASATVQLARSDNGAAVAIVQEFGISRVQQFVAKVTSANPVASELVAIGAGKGIELSPLQLAAAYTVFPNSGVKVAPKSIWAIYDGERKLEIAEQKTIRVVDAGAAFMVARMLQSVIGDGPDGRYGTARIARKLAGLDSTVALAGKTGTGDNDLWFVGFTSRLVVVVWVGFDNNYPAFESSRGFTGSGLPLQIWARFMKGVKKYRPDLLTGNFEIARGQMAYH
jgi:penicillin-binding protein 1B